MHFIETLTTLSLVSGYDAVGHNVEDREQEEANLKQQHKNHKKTKKTKK